MTINKEEVMKEIEELNKEISQIVIEYGTEGLTEQKYESLERNYEIRRKEVSRLRKLLQTY